MSTKGGRDSTGELFCSAIAATKPRQLKGGWIPAPESRIFARDAGAGGTMTTLARIRARMSAAQPTSPILGAEMDGGYGEGFRMPARGDRCSRTGAGVRKPPRKEPAGAGQTVAVYGDLTGQRLG